MTAVWSHVDKLWVRLASVKLTIFVLVSLLLLSIPGTVILQYNISSVDPGLQYSYDFWRFGQWMGLFTAYQSWWYVALLALLSMNLISCSSIRWPGMFKLALAKPVALSKAALDHRPAELRRSWETKKSKDEVLALVTKDLKKSWYKPVVVQDGAGHFQLFWEMGRWSRVANVLVHTSLLVVFLGGILSALGGFEGGANIPEGGAVDTFLLFKEGKQSGLKPAEGGLFNERALGFRLELERFDVSFYKDFPGRPQGYKSRLKVIENGQVVKTSEIEVNKPMKYKGFVFYQSSYGRMGDFRVLARVVDKKKPFEKNTAVSSSLGQAVEAKGFDLSLVPVRALPDVQGLGPGVQFQELRGGKPKGSPFWVLERFPEFDIRSRKDSTYAVVLENLREQFFSGLQIGHDPGAPIYWLGCLGMLLGTFYALLITHRKFHFFYDNGRIDFAGSVHRLPLGFREQIERTGARLKKLTDS